MVRGLLKFLIRHKILWKQLNYEKCFQLTMFAWFILYCFVAFWLNGSLVKLLFMLLVDSVFASYVSSGETEIILYLCRKISELIVTDTV